METNDKVITLTREESKNLRWAMKALATGRTRLTLQYVMQVGKRIVCGDGFRAHSIPCPESLNGQPQSTLRPLTAISRVHRDEYVTAMRVELSKIPDWSKITSPTTVQVASVAVNPFYLRDALDGIDGKCAIIRLWKGTDGTLAPITVESEDGNNISVVMPMHVREELTKEHHIHLVEVENDKQETD